MSSSAVFWQHNFGWFLFMGFLMTVVCVLSVSAYIASDSHKRQQAARITAAEQDRKHIHEKEMLRIKLNHVASGKADPQYIAYLEAKEGK